jgi:hypothetical protein
MERVKKLIDDKVSKAEVDVSQCCIFCFRHKTSIERAQEIAGHCLALSDEYLIAKGALCSYGCGHEYPASKEKPKQVHKQSADICIRCSCHKRNPLYLSNGCQHEHGA